MSNFVWGIQINRFPAGFVKTHLHMHRQNYVRNPCRTVDNSLWVSLARTNTVNYYCCQQWVLKRRPLSWTISLSLAVAWWKSLLLSSWLWWSLVVVPHTWMNPLCYDTHMVAHNCVDLARTHRHHRMHLFPHLKCIPCHNFVDECTCNCRWCCHIVVTLSIRDYWSGTH